MVQTRTKSNQRGNSTGDDGMESPGNNLPDVVNSPVPESQDDNTINSPEAEPEVDNATSSSMDDEIDSLVEALRKGKTQASEVANNFHEPQTGTAMIQMIQPIKAPALKSFSRLALVEFGMAYDRYMILSLIHI